MSELSGAQWCARYPTSTRIEDLAQPFQGNVASFISALRTASALVSISATYRPPQRAHLMHWAWAIARGLPANMCRPGDKPGVPVPPASVPFLAGVDIDWVHGGDLIQAAEAAEAMVQGYHMKVCAALDSRHIERRAIDMDISWNSTLGIRDHGGQLRKIMSSPRTGENLELALVAASYGVHKLITDPPHFSDDGH